MSARVCLVTTGQPSTNPRLVKEADALVEAGFEVHVIGAHWAAWADDADQRLLARRRWQCTIIDWRRETAPVLFWKTRIRHRVARAMAGWRVAGDRILPAAISRVTPELTRLALDVPADLYIAHNLGALPAALAAARRRRARLGFDAEDFHSGEFPSDDRSPARLAIQRAERRYLPECDYVTAAAPLIADQYAPMCAGRRPTCLLNVFPLAARPASQRPASISGPLRLYWFSQTIGPHRGLEDVVRAMSRCTDGDIELFLRGTWSPGYRQALHDVAARAGLNAERIVALAPADPDDLIDLAAQFDVGLAVETGATVNSDILLSNKIFTYLLSGVAVIATLTRGQRPLVESLGKAARGYVPGDIDALSGVLHEWTRDRRALDASRGLAWEWGESRYNWDVEKQRFLQVIAETLGAVSATSHSSTSVGGTPARLRGSAVLRA